MIALYTIEFDVMGVLTFQGELLVCYSNMGRGGVAKFSL